MKSTLLALDLAKNVLQLGIFKGSKMTQNRALSRRQLQAYLVKHEPSVVVMEACATSHYWGRFARAHGHEVKVLDPRFVKAFRVGQKTDANDVVAIASASQAPKVKLGKVLEVEQQALQSIERLRSLAEKQKRQLANQIRGLLLEFGFSIAQGEASFKNAIEAYLEDADNGLPDSFRQALHLQYQLYLSTDEHKTLLDQKLNNLVKKNEQCSRLMKLEGVGPVTALGLWLHLINVDNYKNGRHASACAGVTPQQHSSGGKVRIGHVRKRPDEMQLRCHLFLGARAVVSKLKNREAKTHKEKWLKALLTRRGTNCAAMALANKTVRTAYAMLKNNADYKLEGITS